MNASAREAGPTGGRTGDPRTYVLIPGAGGVAWFWHRVVPLLQAAGHMAIAVDLPGDDPAAGLPEYARVVEAAIDSRATQGGQSSQGSGGGGGGGGDVVLVAMSLGGFTAPLVAKKVPVNAIVFVNAMIPSPGETAGAWWDNTGWSDARVAAAKQGGYTTEVDLPVYFLHDVPPDVAASGQPFQRPEADAAFASVCDFDGWPPVAIRAVAGADDRFFPVAFQQALARDRLGIEPDVLPGGHLIALAHPAELAGYLLAL